MKFRILLSLALAAVLLAACGPAASPAAAPLSSPTAVKLEAGLGGLSGQVSGAEALWPGSEVTLYAAPYTANPDGSGFYILEPNLHPNTLLDPGGYFQLVNAPPGSYVLVVGPEPAGAKLVVDDRDQARVFQVVAGQIQPLGSLLLAR